MTSIQGLHDDISRASIDLIMTDPFYGHFLLGINRNFDDTIPTLGVRAENDGSVLLTINPIFWTQTLSKSKDGVQFTIEKSRLLKKGALKHEILHVVLKHILRCFDRSMSGTLKYPNQKQFNIAADLVVNQYIDSDWLIEGAVKLEHFTSLNLQKEKDVEYYYRKLEELAKPDDSSSNKENENEDDAESNSEDNNMSSSKEKLSELMDSPSGSRGGSHQDWKESSVSGGTSKEVLENYIDKQISQAVQRLDSTDSWSSLPSSLREYLNDLGKEESKLNWRRTIRLFNETSQISKMSPTMKRPSKRYKKISQWPDGRPMYETINGEYSLDSMGNKKPIWESKYPGLKSFPKPRLLVAIDTSGSVSLKIDIPLFFSEVKKLYQKSVELNIVEADTRIRRLYSYGARKISDITGRGGTNFDEVILYANQTSILRDQSESPIELWNSGRWTETRKIKTSDSFDGLIYFTDGIAPEITIRPKIPVLWVLAGRYVIDEKSEEYERLPGNKVIINN